MNYKEIPNFFTMHKIRRHLEAEALKLPEITKEFADYKAYKEKLDTELRKTTEGFVRIGYLLKVAKDTDILKESGYANVYEFAQAEYNIDKSQVSRFININDRFSEGGYSDRLKEQFQGFGHAKLTIMLQLPDEINAELSPEFTKSEIQAIREEYDAEQAVTDLEVLMEGENPQQKVMASDLYKVLHQQGKDEPEWYVKLFYAGADVATVQEALAPDGERIYSIRIMGVGRLMLSVKGLAVPVTLTNMRTGEKEEYSWEDVMEALRSLMIPDVTPEESWERTYNAEFPKKGEVAPVQPVSAKKEAPKKELPKKESKVKKATPLKKKEPEKVPDTEEQIPGQDNVMNHPEYLPKEMQKTAEIPNAEPICEDNEAAVVGETLENVTEQAEIVEKTPLEEAETSENSKWEPDLDTRKVIAGYKAGITNSINRLQTLVQEERWDSMVTAAQDIQWRAEQIMKLMGGQNG